MNVNQSLELLTQFENDLNADVEPELKTWYEQEFMLQPSYIEAKRTPELLRNFAYYIGELARVKAGQSEVAVSSSNPEDELIEPDITPEQPRILTPKEIIQRKIDKKYQEGLRLYRQEYAATRGLNRSKQGRQQQIALRKFARQLCDFKDITGDDHIVEQAEHLDWLLSTLPNATLSNEIAVNCAAYAERHGPEVVADPNNFAHILAASVDGMPNARHFEDILKGLFSDHFNAPHFGTIHMALAQASFELLENPDALRKVVDIASLELPYVTSNFIFEAFRAIIDKCMTTDDITEFLECRQPFTIFGALNTNIVGTGYLPNAKLKVAFRKIQAYADAQEDQNSQFIDNIDRVGDIIGENWQSVRDYAPVTLSSLDGTRVHHLGAQPDANPLPIEFSSTPLFNQRMQHLAPYSFAIAAAKDIIGSGIHGKLFPVSPGVTVEIFIPNGGHIEPNKEQGRLVDGRFHELRAQIFEIVARNSKIGITSYAESGEIKMLYMPLIGDDEKQGIVILRPSIPLDRRVIPSIQLLSLNHFRAQHDHNLPHVEVKSTEQNEVLRAQIKAEQKRFFGRRPIKFVMPVDIRQSGLNAINLRYDPKSETIRSQLSLDDGDVELSLDRDFQILDEDDGRHIKPMALESNDQVRRYYENIILKLARIWTCHQEVSTSDGVVSERTRNWANMGHFAYLRIKQGKRYNFSENQRNSCMEERKLDLATESQRLRPLDPTGRDRNSTYVRENYDPNKPPLEVYYSTLD